MIHSCVLYHTLATVLIISDRDHALGMHSINIIHSTSYRHSYYHRVLYRARFVITRFYTRGMKCVNNSHVCLCVTVYTRILADSHISVLVSDF